MITPEYFRENMPEAQVVFVYDHDDVPEECTITNYVSYRITYGSRRTGILVRRIYKRPDQIIKNAEIISGIMFEDAHRPVYVCFGPYGVWFTQKPVGVLP